MKGLLDKPTLAALRAAVKRHSPDDWAASRALCRAKRMGLWWWVVKLLCAAAVWAFVAMMFVCLPVMPFTETKIDAPAAYGLIALHCVGVGIVFGFMLLGCESVQVSPLAFAPVEGGFVYRYILAVLCQQMLRRLLAGLAFSLLCAVTMQYCSKGLHLASLLTALVGGVLLFGTSCLLGMLQEELSDWVTKGMRQHGVEVWQRSVVNAAPRWLAKASGLLVGLAFTASIYQVARLKFAGLPSPAPLGRGLLFLPQAAVCEWITGGPLSWVAIGSCVAATTWLIALLMERYRDRDLEFDEAGDTLRPTAEYTVAQSLRQWRQVASDGRHSESDWERDADDAEAEDEAEPATPDEQPLLRHAEAPQEHATPTTPAFREVMAQRLRLYLDREGEACASNWWQGYRRWPFKPMRRVLPWTVALGAVVPVLFALPRLLPGMMAETAFGLALSALAIGLIIGVVMLAAGPVFAMPALQNRGPLRGAPWLWLPVERRLLLAGFQAWSGTVLRRHLQLLGTILITALLMWLLLAVVFGQRAELEGMNASLSVLGSALTKTGVLGLGLLALGQVSRCFDPFRYAQVLFAPLRLIRIWRLVKAVFWVLLLGSIGFASGMMVCLVRGVMEPSHAADSLALALVFLLLGEGCRWLCLRYLTWLVGRARSEVLGGR